MSVISGIAGSEAQKSASNTAADASSAAAAKSAEIQKYMFDKMQSIQEPYNQLGLQGLSQFFGSDGTSSAGSGVPAKLTSGMIDNISAMGNSGMFGSIPKSAFPGAPGGSSGLFPEQSQLYSSGGGTGGIDPTGGAGAYKTQMENMPGLDLPELNLGEFNFAFNPDDPTYKYRQSELTKTIDQAAAARGNYNSRPTINAQAEGNIALTGDESEKQFGRALQSYSTNISSALSQFGADYQGATDTYNSGYGKMTDLYNMSMNTGAADYNKILDAIKIGSGSAGQTGSGAQATGQGLANTYGQLGGQLGNAAIGSGQATSDMWGNIGSTNTSLAALYAYLKYIK